MIDSVSPDAHPYASNSTLTSLELVDDVIEDEVTVRAFLDLLHGSVVMTEDDIDLDITA